MQIPHNAAVLVADGRKMLFLRNKGDATHPNLVVDMAEEQKNPADHEQRTDSPGHSAHDGSRRSTMNEGDLHQRAEDRFAVDAAGLLKARALAKDFEALIVVAPPHTLGELRKHYHDSVSARIVGELDKDLTDFPIADIESAIKAA
ncbi:host attachment protein [Sphingomonas oligophenolica]|uniref:Host attachment family protein n=1 Tax=Sphingomonas oligophenolica TaxID=301154 RepID=A0ABU9Y4L5_9SPHN